MHPFYRPYTIHLDDLSLRFVVLNHFLYAAFKWVDPLFDGVAVVIEAADVFSTLTKSLLDHILRTGEQDEGCGHSYRLFEEFSLFDLPWKFCSRLVKVALKPRKELTIDEDGRDLMIAGVLIDGGFQELDGNLFRANSAVFSVVLHDRPVLAPQFFRLPCGGCRLHSGDRKMRSDIRVDIVFLCRRPVLRERK